MPLHRELAERGQVELTTTPFYHPILPLLCDKRLARQAMPDVDLPQHLDGYRRGRGEHSSPRGRVPREAVRREAARHVALGRLGLPGDHPAVAARRHPVDRHRRGDPLPLDRRLGLPRRQGYLRNPEMLYRPWRVEEQGQTLQIVFRDHAMSDQIGFHYQRVPAAAGRRRFHRQAGGHRPRHRSRRRAIGPRW